VLTKRKTNASITQSRIRPCVSYQHQVTRTDNLKYSAERYDIKIDKCTLVYGSLLYTLYTSYMFRPLMWPSSGRCITKDRYIEILQKFGDRSTDIKYSILKIMHCLKHTYFSFQDGNILPTYHSLPTRINHKYFYLYFNL
jgi:hypothetical protein